MGHRSSDGRLNLNKPPSTVIDDFFHSYKIHKNPVMYCKKCKHPKGCHATKYTRTFQASAELTRKILSYTYCKEEDCDCKMFEQP